MSRPTWAAIKQSKHFYIITYRATSTALFVSIVINVLLGLAIHYAYFSRTQPAFYATNGVTPPVMLTAREEANASSAPLLASNQEQTDEIKLIPQ